MSDAIDALEGLAKGDARGGKYFRRVATGNPKRPWRYYYTRAQYEREHGPIEHVAGHEEAQARREQRGGEVKLTKKQLLHALKHGTYSVISAGRNPNHPDEAKLPEDHPSFDLRHQRLRRQLQFRGFKFTEVEGHYGGKEKSFIVFHDDDAKAARGAKREKSLMVHHKSPSEFSSIRKLGAQYNQDSVIHSHRGQHEMHYTSGENAGKFHKGEGHKVIPHADDFYTHAPTKRGATKFALNFEWDAKHPKSAAMLKAMRASKKAKKMRKHPVSEAQRRWAFAAEERGELPEGKALEWSRRIKAGTAPMSKSEGTMDAIEGLARLVKSGEQAGHKYIKRTPDGRGGWTYQYAHEGEAVSHPTKLNDAHDHVVHALHAIGAEKGEHLSVHVASQDERRPASEAGKYHTVTIKDARGASTGTYTGHPYGVSPSTMSQYTPAHESRKGIAAFEKQLGASSKKHGKAVQPKAAKAGATPKKRSAASRSQVPATGADVRAHDPDTHASELSRRAYETDRMHGGSIAIRQGPSREHHEDAAKAHEAAASAQEARGRARMAESHRESAKQHRALASKFGKSQGAHPMIESTPSIRKSFRGLDGAQPLAKGLYKFGDYSQNAKMQAIPDEYLLAYLDAFIEEATEHEMREKAHALDAMTMGPTPGGPEHSLAQWVMNELVSYMTCNANLMRAVKMCNCTKDYIADRISAMGLLKPLASHRTDHGDYLQGFMYSEEQEAGYVGKSYGPNTVLDESAMLKAVAHTRAAARAVDGSPVQFAADDPMQALGDFHRAQRARVQAYYGEGSARFDPHAGAPLPKR